MYFTLPLVINKVLPSFEIAASGVNEIDELCARMLDLGLNRVRLEPNRTNPGLSQKILKYKCYISGVVQFDGNLDHFYQILYIKMYSHP